MLNVGQKVSELRRMTVGELRREYAAVFGEPARSGNRQWLFRRIAWRIQMLAEGDLATRALERAHSRAKELARDADLRVRPPHGPGSTPAAERVSSASAVGVLIVPVLVLLRGLPMPVPVHSEP